ncbi:hypothetical protein F7018_04590 [Tenacibaculum aiptasiae]|uniref:HRDC domain-containing protein n=1 Tax=Tenacibaculum aiptasiae TaxID=426481 RepID=A0A7J5APQ0_9FLAO|nr:biopolymer transporter ExbD [Tenacibaculum aiptasiae]KAB1159591.1 hypothetical protein F7018_04590 [Tenacibaculum aiptasiae]
MKKILTILCFLYYVIPCLSQKQRPENEFMTCLYKSYKDNGIKLKKVISNFEQLLIKEKILEDNTGRSYKTLFEKIIINNDFNYNISESFSEKLKKVKQAKKKPHKNCQLNLKNKLSKTYKLQFVLDSIVKNSTDLSPSIIAKGILNVLNEKDFELDYYKMNTLLLFDTLKYINNQGIPEKLPNNKTENIEYDLNSAINVYINGDNQIFIDNEKVSLKQLKKRIRDYQLKNKSKSIISIKADRATMYSTYVDVQKTIIQEIKKLRELLAKEKYKTTFDKLNKKQLIQIKKTYPQKIISIE